MDVEFIDVWKDPKPGKAYKIKLIPTQIFFDASGKERFRHEGLLRQGGHPGQVEGARGGY